MIDWTDPERDGGCCFIGTTAAIVAAAIAGGSSVAGAGIAAHAAGKAAKTQTAAADKALALEHQQYEQQREDLAPYRGLSAVLPSLMGRAGQPVTSTGWGQYQTPTAPTTAPNAGPNSFAAMYQGATSVAPGMASGGGPAGMVTLRSPDGKSTRAVPADHVQAYLSKGATVVNR